MICHYHSPPIFSTQPYCIVSCITLHYTAHQHAQLVSASFTAAAWLASKHHNKY